MGTTKTRTLDEIRLAVRAELPGLRALAARLRSLMDEMGQTPERARWGALLDSPGEGTDEFHELHVYVDVIGTLDGGVQDLQELARAIAQETDPKRWREAKRRAPQWRAEAEKREDHARAELEAERAKRLAVVTEGRGQVREIAETLRGVAAEAPLPPEKMAQLLGGVADYVEVLGAIAWPERKAAA